MTCKVCSIPMPSCLNCDNATYCTLCDTNLFFTPNHTACLTNCSTQNHTYANNTVGIMRCVPC